jgi:hypothetical protein
MLRRLALAALLALAPSLASAQFATIGPTPPTSDNGDRLATTAWVNAFAAGSIPLQSGKIFIGSAGNLAVGQTPSGDCTLSLSGVITCTQAAGNFTVVGNLSVGGSIIDGNGILATNIAAPATPAAGTTRIYVDSTTKTLSAKNDAGTVSNTVVASLAVANQFMTGISSSGVITRAQPAFSDLSGQGTCAQEPALTGNVTSSAGSCATTIGANQVARSMQAQGVARSVIGVTGNATANVADIQGTASQFLVVNSGGTALAFTTMSGDCTLSGGAITCTKTNGTNFATVATSGSASDLGTGTLNSARLAWNGATFTGTPTNPTATTSLTAVHMGVGSTCAITPSFSTRVFFSIQGVAANSTANQVTAVALRFGTGAAPANGAAATGTLIGAQQAITIAGGNTSSGFGLSGVVTGRTPGVALWFDVTALVSANTGTITNITCTAYEL